MPDRYFEEYTEWREEYRQQSEGLFADVHYTLEQTPEQRQKMNFAGSVLNNIDKDVLKQEADRFIEQQKLNKVANAYGTMEKLEEIKQVAKIQGVEINTFELDFLIAETLQRNDAGEDPYAEYRDWIEQQQSIEDRINSDGTTQEEVDARGMFISFLGDRETEMRRVIALYAGAAVYGNGPLKEQALERLAFMNFKLSELRRLRVKTQATKDRADSQEELNRIQDRKQARIMAAGAMMLAHENMVHRYLRNKSGIDSREFEQGIGEEFVRFRPVTETREAAENKIETFRRNGVKTAILLTEMRMGKSREEIEKERLFAKMPPKVRRLNGFQKDVYRQIYESRRLPA